MPENNLNHSRVVSVKKATSPVLCEDICDFLFICRRETAVLETLLELVERSRVQLGRPRPFASEIVAELDGDEESRVRSVGRSGVSCERAFETADSFMQVGRNSRRG